MTDLLSPLHHVGDGILRPRIYWVLVRVDALCPSRQDYPGMGKAAAEYGLAMREAVEEEAAVSKNLPGGVTSTQPHILVEKSSGGRRTSV
jgi:hypothetical protein